MLVRSYSPGLSRARLITLMGLAEVEYNNNCHPLGSYATEGKIIIIIIITTTTLWCCHHDRVMVKVHPVLQLMNAD